MFPMDDGMVVVIDGAFIRTNDHNCIKGNDDVTGINLDAFWI